MTLDRLRKDRQVDELFAVGPDPLHFMAVFGSSATTATTYAAADMLSTAIDSDGSASSPDKLRG